LALTAPAYAQVNGAIYTTTATGTTVNGNIYANKTDVYLSGGPQNKKDPGLSPDGFYYFQVTDPSGAVLLSKDDITCRVVYVKNGRVDGIPGTDGSDPTAGGFGSQACYHHNGTVNDANGALPVQLCNPDPAKCLTDYADTPSPGGEYKACMTPVTAYVGPSGICQSNNVFGFCDSASKTDNFKIHKAGQANVTVCKFDDFNGNGIQDPGEPLIPIWPITATGVDTTGAPSGTGQDGCATYNVTFPSGSSGPQTVTFTEGSQAGFTQTAPANSTACTLTGSVVNPQDTCTVTNGTSSTPPSSGGVITLTVSPDDIVTAPYFGNLMQQSLSVTKTAFPAYKFTWGITKSVDKPEIDTSSGSGTFNYTVTATNNGPTGWMVSGTISVYNPNGYDIIGVTVTDLIDDGGSCIVTKGSGVTVSANSTSTFLYTCNYSSAPTTNPGINTATVQWNDIYGNPQSASGSATADFSTATVSNATVTVTDTLGSTLGTVTASADPSTWNVALTTTPNAPTTSSGPGVFNYSYTVAGTAGTCVTQPNTATFTATDNSNVTGSSSQVVAKVCVGADLAVSKTANPSFTRTYNWTINKSANPTRVNQASGTSAPVGYSVTASETGFTDSAWQVTGNITVTNPNDWEAVIVNVTDAIDNGGTCTVTGGAGVSAPKKSAGANGSVTVAYTCTYSSAPSPASFTNTATATWDKVAASTPDSSATGTATGNFGSVPPTKVNQTITPTDSFNGLAAVNLCTLASSTPCTLTATDTIPYTTQTYTYSRSESVPTATCTTYPNTASTGLTATGQASSASVKVCGASDLTVSKTAVPTYLSNITKTGPTSPVEHGGASTLTYTIKVTENGWQVAGNIYVKNPNDWEDVTVGLTDTLSGFNCPNNSVTVTRGTTATVPYACTPTGVPSASGTNSVTASWSGAFTPDTSATSTAPYTFASLTVTDSFNGANPGKTLGTISVPNATTTYTDSYAVTPPAGACTTNNNTASDGVGSSSVTVSACNTNTGALTMGFWQNKNGQGIITASGPATGTCALGTWLSGFAPFQDLTSGSTCSQVATYVYNIIKVASAGGATMNAMLKAQDLATSLDVYFSASGVVGSTSLGGVKIDLTHVCNMVDNTSGGGSCSGTSSNVSAAFGGATSLTVLQMLSYAASQSNAGGINWYGQNKTIQGLAKDVFDAINNQAANIAP